MQLTMWAAFHIWLQFPGAPTIPPSITPPPPPIITPAPAPTPPPVTPPANGCTGTMPHPGDICWQNQWWINATYFGQPGPTNFSSQDVSIDGNGYLHIKVQQLNGRWSGGQVESEKSDYGYGTYKWVLGSPVYFDPNIASGLFTYNQSDPSFSHRELDAIEGSKFGWAGDINNSQFTVQPYSTIGNTHRFIAADSAPTVTMVWTPTKVTFNYDNQQWVYTGTIPTPSVQVFMNMWTYATPSAGGDLVIKSFSYTP